MATPQPMSDRERDAWVEALRWRRMFDDTHPDVGFGPSTADQLSDLLRRANADVGYHDYKVVLATFETRYPKDAKR